MTNNTQRQARLSAYYNQILMMYYVNLKILVKYNSRYKSREMQMCDDLQVAIRRSGLKDGMTISFHHAWWRPYGQYGDASHCRWLRNLTPSVH